MKIRAIIISLVSVTNLFLYGNKFESKGDLIMYLDSYQYNGSDDSTIVELSYSIDLAYLNYLPPNEYQNKILLNISVESEQGTNIFNKALNSENLIGMENDKDFTGLSIFTTNDDSVKITLSYKDIYIDRQSTIEGVLKINKYKKIPSLSEIMFIKSLSKSSSKSDFNKGGLDIIPLVNRTFLIDSDKKTYYVYYQLNNLHYTNDIESWYSPKYELIGTNDVLLKELKSEPVLKTSANSARLEKIDISGLEVGKYILKIYVEDLTTGDILETVRDFYISEKVSGKNQFIPMSKDDIKKYKNQMKYIASYEEKKLFKKLSNEGKQNFIINFWNRRDPDLSTEENEFLIEHFKRLNYCDSNIKGGENSDMGRIFIKYGSPVEINRTFSSTSFAKPVEIWEYALNGVKKFVFVDRMENGEYVLVHSNHDDEINNPNWAKNF